MSKPTWADVKEIATRLQDVIAWECIFEHAADFLREQRNVTESNGTLRAVAKENAKILYCEIEKFSNDLQAVREYFEQHDPKSLDLVPTVNLLRKPPADLQSMANQMVKVRTALLLLEPKPPRKKREQANPIRDAVYDVLKRNPKLENDEIQQRVENLLSTTFDDDGAKVRHYVAEYFQQHPDKLPPNRRQRPKKRKT